MVYKNLVYLSYGNSLEYKRAIFSILTFMSWCNDVLGVVRITLYTDCPNYFKPYFGDRVRYVELTPIELENMGGVDQFIHRRKVIVIQRTFQQFKDEDVIFVDSDTFFISPASRLFKGIDESESFMHIREYQLGDATSIFSEFNQGDYPAKFIDFITKKSFKVGNKVLTFTSSDYSWNSGVLGLSRLVGEFMADILKLTDEFYSGSQWFVSEQLAFSLVLQNLTSVNSSETYVCHYWGNRQKILIDRLLLNYFTTIVPNSVNIENVKKTTELWNKLILNDWILEQIQIARVNRSWRYVFKKIVRFAYINGLNRNTYIEIKKALV